MLHDESCEVHNCYFQQLQQLKQSVERVKAICVAQRKQKKMYDPDFDDILTELSKHNEL